MRQLLVLIVLLFTATIAHALEIVPYTPEKLQALQKSGQAHALHFHASWCGTCLEQERALERLERRTALGLLIVQALAPDLPPADRVELEAGCRGVTGPVPRPLSMSAFPERVPEARPRAEGEWRPTSFYDRIKYNLGGGMHTLCLLDIKVVVAQTVPFGTIAP